MNRRRLLTGIAAALLAACEPPQGTITYVYCSHHGGVDRLATRSWNVNDVVQCKDGTFAYWHGATTYGPKSQDGWVIYVQ